MRVETIDDKYLFIINRAKLYGWPNTYVFTKAMGEMHVAQLRGNLPVIIMRPTIVCSTLKEPFPGWVEGCRYIYVLNSFHWLLTYSYIILVAHFNFLILLLYIFFFFHIYLSIQELTVFFLYYFKLWFWCRTLDSVAVAYGKGSLKLFLADGTSVLDLVSLITFT